MNLMTFILNVSIRLSTLSGVSSHTRFLFTLRSSSSKYHSLLLFRLSPSSHSPNDQLYVMESACPHLGADLSHAEIEEAIPEDHDGFGPPEVVAVCPWHRYDFDLRTGVSDTGLRACTYRVEIRGDEVWVEKPSLSEEWELVELRPVSEDFADPPPTAPHQSASPPTALPESDEPVVPSENPPNSLIDWAILILNTSNATLKVARTRYAVKAFSTGAIKSIGRSSTSHPPDIPPRDDTLRSVEPGKAAKRGKAGSLKSRIAMLHALANIEQWAIDLAWDIIARFGKDSSLPHQFYSDFAKVALDESKHFTLLVARIHALGSYYGAHPIHSALWQSAVQTSSSLRSRLAIIHLVHEARGLDVNPATIAKFRQAQDLDSVEILEIIHNDEITHVTAGHRWFVWECAKNGITDPGDVVDAFRQEVKRGFRGEVKGPFNVEDRKKAGMGGEFYEGLKGEMDDVIQGERANVEIRYGI
ncbi:DUF455-domain-containing protein [Sistotremastrum niveocremeum HHB9708]|uniref:DUF455-domain-containing protein n=1 Tax=Sistotremastrum niveocremeum HHB9708 TaxID=1314777 RepID=A0A164MJE3_9AGAM|nr:DUF455-domain-containing protein [Sistotremastrum niveocremeum HHB9708]